MLPLHMNIVKSDNQSTQLDGGGISTRSKKQNLHRDISRLIQEEQTENEIIDQIYQTYSNVLSRTMIVQEVRKKIGLKNAPKNVPTNPITNYTISSIQQLKNQVNQLTLMVSSLRDENLLLKDALQQQQVEETKQVFTNKIQLALQLHEYESEQIIQRFKDSKHFEKAKDREISLYYLELDRKIKEIEQQLKYLDERIIDKEDKSKYTQILYYQQLQQEQQELTQKLLLTGALQEESLLNVRIYTNLMYKNKFKDFTLPCFYPTFLFMEHPLQSRKPVREPPNRPRYVLLRLLGEGGFSKVYKAYNIATSEFVALKISLLQNSSAAKWKLILREAQETQQLKHKNIVRMGTKPVAVRRDLSIANDVRGGSIEPKAESKNDGDVSEIALEMELCEPVSLFEFVCIHGHRAASQNDAKNNEKWLLSIFVQIAEALAYLHSKNYTHNDISLTNILKQGTTWKLSDFSLIKKVELRESQNVTTLATTKPFAPPEKVLKRKFSPASDMYSFGVTMFVAFTSNLELFKEVGDTFAQHNVVDPAAKVRDWFAQEQDQKYSCAPEVQDIIVNLLNVEPERRMTAKQLVDALDKILKKLVKKVKK